MAGLKEPLIGYGLTAAQAYRRRLMGRLGLEKTRGKKAIDLGCGEGYLAEFLAALGYRVEGLDLVAHPLWPVVTRRFKGRVRFRRADAQHTGARPGSYDLVFEKDMLHHAPDPLAALKEMVRLARPGGRLVIIEANRLNPIFYLHLTLMGNHQHFTRGGLCRLLDEAGMEGFSLQKVESRVYPVNREWFQNIMERVQDLAESLPFLGPFLCYHQIQWIKPLVRKRR